MADFDKHPAPGPGSSDPYRYGPPQPIDTAGQSPTGKQILTASWRLLKQDRSLIVLPLISSVASVIAFAILFVPGFFVTHALSGDNRVSGWVGGVLGVFLASVVAIYFQAALVIGAYQRADGHDPTFEGVLAAAWQLRKQIVAWAVFTTIVGTIIRAVEERLGIFGRIIGFLGGVAWAVASFFVVPVIVAEGLGPVAALKKSAGTIRQLWGTSVRTTLRFGLIQLAVMIVPFVLVVAGIVMAMSATSAGIGTGVVLIVIGGVVLIVVGSVFGAIGMYARGLIYRWSTGRPVPGIDGAVFAGAFAVRRGRRR